MYNKIIIQGLQWIEAGMEENPISIVPIRRLDCQPFCIEVFKEDFANDISGSWNIVACTFEAKNYSVLKKSRLVSYLDTITF